MRNFSPLSTLLAALAIAALGACSDANKKKSAAPSPPPEQADPETETKVDTGEKPPGGETVPPVDPGTEEPLKSTEAIPVEKMDDPEGSAADKRPVVPGFPRNFSGPGQLSALLASKLREGKTDDVMTYLGEDLLDAPKAYGFKWALTEGGFGVDPEQPVQDVGEMGVLQRQAIRLLSVAESGETDREKVYLDLRRDAKAGWRVEALSVSPTLRAKAMKAGLPKPLPAVAANGDEDDPAGVPDLILPGAETGDALTDADTFLTAVLDQDYVTAVRLCDPDKVPEEKIAALCIVFEEGDYRMKPVKPLMATAVGEDSPAAWIIAHVESDKVAAKSEFGIEMTFDPEKGWKITGLNFSEMLARFAAASEAGKVPFTPLVKSPEGGESLVLYFEYDDAGITKRAKRQIEIISSILRNDPDKRLRVSGHADARGPDEYNRKLSLQRAETVKVILADLGVPAEQIITEAAGEALPLRPNTLPDGSDDPTGRSHNRRAELYLDF